MRFKGLDLNLLVALDQLLAERSVSRAGEKLCRSQSTVSGALARLREQFGDELLVQVGRELEPTPRALELQGAVRDLLLQIEARVLARPRFDPAQAERSVRIFASDYMTIVGLADALRAMQRQAPGLRFLIEQPAQQQDRIASPAELLENGRVDFLLMPRQYVSERHPFRHLFTEDFCVILCRDNTAVGDRITPEEFFAMRHVTVGLGPQGPSYEVWFDREYGGRRRVDVTAASFSTVPFLIPGTPRIALAHRRLAEAFARLLPIRILDAPFAVPPLEQTVQWHEYSGTDPGLMWVRDRIVETLGDPAA